MKRIQPLAALLLALAVGAPAQTVTPAPSMMNFQGRLAKPDGTPVPDGLYSVVVSIYDAPTGGTRLWTQTFTGAIARNGVFAIPLGATNGTQGATTPIGSLDETLFVTDRWIQVQLGSTSAPLLPRQLFLPVALAFKANMALTVPNGSITGVKIAAGSITADKFAPGVLSPLAWLLGGNVGTNSYTNFLGTTDNNPLIIKVNGFQSMRYDYASNTTIPGFYFRSINTLGGSSVNSIAGGTVGSTISGGGRDNFMGLDGPNVISAGDFAFIGGGENNKISGTDSVISGGANNTITNSSNSVIGGGVNNTLSGYTSFIAGGDSNSVTGDWSFAAGRGAQANHTGTLVWNGAPSGTFASTSAGQVLFNAPGGFGINTNNPAYPLDVNGAIRTRSGGVVFPDGTTQITAGLSPGSLAGGDVGGLLSNLILNQNVVKSGNLASDANSLSRVTNGNAIVNQSGGDAGFIKVIQGLSVNGVTPNFDPGWDTGTRIWAQGGFGARYDSYQHRFDIGSTRTEAMRINAYGNVGIGTTAPGQKLSVAGIIESLTGGFKFPDGSMQTTAGLTSLPTIGGDISGPLTNLSINPNVVNSGKLASDAASLNKVAGGAMQSDGTSVSVAGNESVGGNITSNTLNVNGLTSNGAATVGGVSALNGGVTSPWTELYSSTPYIDFHYNYPTFSQDYNVRLINDHDGQLSLYGNENVTGSITANGNILLNGSTVWHIDSSSNNFRVYHTNNPELVLAANGDLNINGSFRAAGDVYARGMKLTSDARYKTNIHTLDNALASLLNLRGVSYDWDRAKWPSKNFDKSRQIGFLAQELEKQFPELVGTDEEGYKSVNYIGVVPVLVEGMKQQQKQINDLKAENNQIKAQMKEFAIALKQLKSDSRRVRFAGK